MNTPLIERILGANNRLRGLAIAFIASALIYNFPWLLNWLPEETRKQLLTAADYVLKYGIGLVLLWAKQSNVSGTGSSENPHTVSDGTMDHEVGP